nr:hypothetical protein [Alphaproteobacteria bacterium]
AKKSLLFHVKRFGHIASKGRYVAAQAVAMLTDDRWLVATERAHHIAQLLGEGIRRSTSSELVLPAHSATPHGIDGNLLCARIPQEQQQRLREAGAVFYDWTRLGTNAVRLVTSHASTEEEVASFVRLLEA